jgi:glycosyltransferase involved in cell wall biosynthesis
LRIGFYIYDLTEENRRRMPWRTAFEVAAGMRRAGHEAILLSGRDGPRRDGDWSAQDVAVREIAKPLTPSGAQALIETGRAERLDLLYLPLDWFRPRYDFAALGQAAARIVWYIPGSHYRARDVIAAARFLGWKRTLPYLAQSLYPARWVAGAIRRRLPAPLVTMSEYSRRVITKAGYPGELVRAIPPGKDEAGLENQASVEGGAPVYERLRSRLNDRPWFLFFGPPQAIRGIWHLVGAFRRVLERRSDARLVCLFRSDADAPTEAARQRIEALDLSDRIFCVWSSVGRSDLAAFARNCHAVVLPFLLVPSEIPLAVIETAGFGKPIITTGPGGTGEFAERFGLAVAPANEKALAGAMSRLLLDKTLHSEKCKAAAQVYAAHPTWDEVARAWLAMGEQSV